MSMLRHLILLLALAAVARAAEGPTDPQAGWRGLAVQLGADPGRAVRLARPEGAVLHVLAPEVDAVAAAIRDADLDHRATVEPWPGSALPHADRTVDLLVVEPGMRVDGAEIGRVLAPGGTAWVAADGGWRRIDGGPPIGDGWTHQRHGADGNPVSADQALAVLPQSPPERVRWVNDVTELWPEATRIADGRVFLVAKAPGSADDALVRCRSAWNGILHWSAVVPGAAAGARPNGARFRPVVAAGRLYLFRKRLVALDVASGAESAVSELAPLDLIAPADGKAGLLVARIVDAVIGLDPATLRERWRVPAALPPAALVARREVVPAESLPSLVADASSVYTVEHTDAGLRAIAIDLATGARRELAGELGATAWPALVADGVLVVGGKGFIAGLPVDGRGASWRLAVGEPGKVGKDGKPKPRSEPDMGPRLLNCALAQDGTLWIRETLRLILGPGEAPPQPAPVMGWIAIGLRDGAIGRRIGYPTARPWGGIVRPEDPTAPFTDQPIPTALRNWSPRCYGDIGVPGAIVSQTMEIVGLAGEEPRHLRGVRGHCGIGFALGAGAVITPPNQCLGCYPMLRGEIAYEPPAATGSVAIADGERLQRGPAFAAPRAADPAGGWPMLRASPLRTNCVDARVDPTRLAETWSARTPGRPSQPVIAGGTVVVAAVASGRITALDAATGAPRWQTGLPGRVDSPPSLHAGLVIAGCHDGRVYALDRSDGRLAWRFTAAPAERRIVAGDRIESPWPVLGSVLIDGGTVHAIAGHHTTLDGGLQRWGLDAATGAVRYRAVFTGVKGPQAAILPSHWYRHEEAALNNLLLGGSVGGVAITRLYDQWGGWDFRADDGGLLRQHRAVPQPGWPKGRLTPGAASLDDRWPWAGYDRIASARIMRGVALTYADTLEIDPRTRLSGSRGQMYLWPRPGAPGVLLKTKDGKTTVDPEPWIMPTDPKEFAEDKAFAELPARKQADLWAPVQVPLRAAAAIITGDVLWLAGTVPAVAEGPATTGSALLALSLTDGAQLGRWDVEGGIAFEGLSTAGGRIYLAHDDGTIRCFAAKE